MAPLHAQGLYDPRHEHDACGVGFVAHIKGRRTHAIIQQGLAILGNLAGVGATEKGQIQMIDYKEDTLPFYQGGTIRPQPRNAFLNVETEENWPTFLTITREIWDNTDESKRARLEVLKTFRGWAYAAKGRVVEVMVVKKRPSTNPQSRSDDKK